MEHSRFGLSSLVALAFTILIICTLAHAVQETSLTPASLTSSLPLAVRDRLSPLTRKQEAYYGKLMKSGAMTENVLYEFCRSARLFCGAALHESTWGSTMGAKTMSDMPFSESSVVDKAAFLPWRAKGSLPRGSAIGASTMYDMPISESSVVDKAVSGGWLAKGSEPEGLQDHSTLGRKGKNSLPSSSGSSTMGKPGTKHEGLHKHSSARTYFRETDLTVGTELVLPQFLYEFRSNKGDANEVNPSFLPASLAHLLPPFDTHHLNNLLQFFHIPFDTYIAREIEDTLTACTGQGVEKADSFIINFCATSFEAMLKFASSMLTAPTNKIQALTNSKVVGSHGDHLTIVRTVELAAGHNAVDCHGLISPFKMMGCHRIKDSKSLLVRVANEKGLNMDLLVACHKNTALFDPHHEAFSQLKSSPGHTEICHFLPNEDIMWVPL